MITTKTEKIKIKHTTPLQTYGVFGKALESNCRNFVGYMSIALKREFSPFLVHHKATVLATASLFICNINAFPTCWLYKRVVLRDML